MRAAILSLSLLVLIPAFSGCLGDDAGGKDATSIRQGGKQAKAPGLDGAGSFVATAADGTLVDPSLLLGVPALAGEQRFLGTRTFEPTIGINKAGHLFMVAFGGGAKIYKSMDQGVTWKDTTARLATNPTNGQPIYNPPNSNDPFVWVDRETGRVFSSDLQALICSWLNFSDDGGSTWTTNPIGCGHPFGVHDHQSIATGKARSTPTAWNNRMVYYCINRVGDSSCAASHTGGLNFGPLVTVMLGVDVERGGLCGGLTGHVKTDNAGRVLWGKNQCSAGVVAISEDDGRTWFTRVVTGALGIRGHDVEIAADAKDNLYAFFIAGNGLPHLAISKDHGRTWAPPINVAPPSLTASKFNAIAANAEGKIAFSYLGTTHPGGFKNADEAQWEGALWHGYIGVMVDALAPNPITLTTMVDSDKDPMAKGSCAGRCSGMGDFFDIQIDPQGRPWTAFVDVCTEKCASGGQHDGNQGVTGTLATGPALTAEGGALPALPPLAIPATAQ